MTRQVTDWVRRRTSSEALRDARNTFLLVCGYVAVYLTLERVSLIQELPDSRFALWDPPAACSLALLLIKGLRYAPAVFVAGVIADRLIDGFPTALAAVFVAEAIITAGYSVIAIALRRVWGASRSFNGTADILYLLGIVSAGVLAIAGMVGTALIFLGEVPSDRFLPTVRHFWIGDLTGIVGLFPALIIAPLAWQRWNEVPPLSRFIDLAGFVLGLALALWTVFGLATDTEVQFFYLLLLPVVWISVRHGLPWCAIAILVQQLALISVVTILGYPESDFLAFQVLSLVIASTGLILGAIVTERQQAELLLRRQQAELGRMARLTTAGALGSAIAHEVSQPLATIATYSHACRRLLKLQPEVLPETLEKMEAEVLRLGEMVDRLRDFLSKGIPRLDSVDLADLARRIAAALADEARSRGAAISVDAEPVPKIPGDRIQIEQVLVNLLRNAIEAAAEGTSREKRARVGIRHYNGAVQVEVEDNGPGVLPDIAERLFEPFETTKARGMGLGLSLSRQMVEGHGGKLWWDKTFVKGTRFVFSMPLEGSKLSER
jgi:two-component system, LuxR family, sensor kinase FixL